MKKETLQEKQQRKRKPKGILRPDLKADTRLIGEGEKEIVGTMNAHKEVPINRIQHHRGGGWKILQGVVISMSLQA